MAGMTQPVAGRPGDIGDASVMGADMVAAALEVDVETGLSAQQAASRLAQNGPNELRSAPRVPAWRRVLAQCWPTMHDAVSNGVWWRHPGRCENAGDTGDRVRMVSR